MKRNLYILYAISFLQGMVFYGPIATLYRQAQGVSIFQITMIESISLALGILLEIPWGIVADKIGYRKTMIFCSVIYFASKIVFWKATGFFYIIATLLGLLGIYSPAFTKRMGMRRSLLSFCCLPIVSCTLLALTSHVLPSVISIWTLRISDTFFQPFQSELQNRQVRTKNRATELSINSMFISCIAIGTNLIFGTLSDWYLPSAFFFGSIICTFSLLLFLFWHQTK